MQKDTQAPSLFRRDRSQYWYMSIIDPSTGRRIKKSTKEMDRDRALASA